MLMRNQNTGAFELYDIASNQITFAGPMGQVGLEWQVVGFGPMGGPGTGDMLMRNSNTGTFEVYDIVNNKIVSAGSMGQVGTEWSVAGVAALSASGTSSANAQLTQAMASFGPTNGVSDTGSALSGLTDQLPAPSSIAFPHQVVPAAY